MRALVPCRPGELSDEDLEDLYRHPPGTHVRANFIMSLDGAVELGGRSGPLGCEDDRRLFNTLRALCDVILVGAQTVRREDYGPAVLGEARRLRRQARGQGQRPPIAVVSASGQLDPGSRFFSGAGDVGYRRPLLFVGREVDGNHRERLDAVADVFVSPQSWVDVRAVVGELADRGYHSMLCEGGPTLLSELIRAELLDELCLTYASVVAGPGRSGMTAGLPFEGPVAADLEVLIAGDGAMLGRYHLQGRRSSDD